MIKRSNERLRMLDEMGKARQLKLQQDLARLEQEKDVEKNRRDRIRMKRETLDINTNHHMSAPAEKYLIRIQSTANKGAAFEFDQQPKGRQRLGISKPKFR